MGRRPVKTPATEMRHRPGKWVFSSSLEIFINDGETVLTTYVYSGEGAALISAFSEGGNTLLTV